MRSHIVPALLLLLWTAPALAQHFESSPTTAVLYKNGLSYVVEEGRGKTDDGVATTVVHAVPLAGTFNVQPKGNAKVVEVRARPVAPLPEDQLLAMLPQLGNRPLLVRAGEKSWTGRYLGALSTPAGTMLMLRITPGEEPSWTVLIPVGEVTAVELPATTEDPHLAPVNRENRVEFRFADADGSFQLSYSYMTGGLGWSPAYLLDMSGGDKGDLILNAIVVNDALDLQSVKVQFATGEASFPFSYLASPLFDPGITTAEIMRAVMAFVDQGPYTWRGSRYDNSMNMMQAQQMMAPPPPGGEVILAHEETWLYGPAEVSLARGERMILPLGKGSIPAKLVYYWEVPNPPSADASVNTVRLAAALTNTLDFPLTTGPMLITKDGRPLGQGAIRYTHQGEKTIVPFSLGSGVLCSGFEQEAGRDRASLRLGDTKYDKVSIKGTLQIRNALARDATVHVKRELSGKLRTASDDGKVEERLASAWDPNPTSTVRWVLEVGKGATREISYQYDYFVPSGSYSY